LDKACLQQSEKLIQLFLSEGVLFLMKSNYYAKINPKYAFYTWVLSEKTMIEMQPHQNFQCSVQSHSQTTIDKQLLGAIPMITIKEKSVIPEIKNLRIYKDFPLDDGLIYKGVTGMLKDFVPTKPCSEYVLDLCSIPSIVTTKFMFIKSEIDMWYSSFKWKSNPSYLDENECVSIAWYAWDILQNGNREENFYYQLNKSLLERNPELLNKFSGYLWYFQRALSKLPNICIDVYRGIDTSGAVLIKKEYVEHRPIHWSAYSSTTSDLSVAKKFAGKSGIILKIKIFNGKSVTDYSPFPTENEVILSPNMRFIVSSDVYAMNDYCFIDLIQFDKDDTFVF